MTKNEYTKKWREENKEKTKEQNRKAAKKYYEKHREKKLEEVKEYYKKNKEKAKKYQKKWREENKEKKRIYNNAYFSIRINELHKRKNYKSALKERTLVPSPEEISFMVEAINIFCKKYKLQKEEVKGEGYLSLLKVKRNYKEKYAGYKRMFFIKSIILKLIKNYNSESKKLYRQRKNCEGLLKDKTEISLNTPVFEDGKPIELSSLIASKMDTDIQKEEKIDCDYFKKEIKKMFIIKRENSSNSKKYTGQLLYSIWYDKFINDFKYKELAEKYKMNIKAMESLVFSVICPLWLKIREELLNTSNYQK